VIREIPQEEVERRYLRAKEMLESHKECYCRSYWELRQEYDEMRFLLGVDKD